MPRLELFPFRFRDPLTKKWVRARYVAELHEIAARYGEFEVVGPPEIRDVDPEARYFNPAQGQGMGIDTSVANLGPVHAIRRPTTRWLIPVCGTAT